MKNKRNDQLILTRVSRFRPRDAHVQHERLPKGFRRFLYLSDGLWFIFHQQTRPEIGSTDSRMQNANFDYRAPSFFRIQRLKASSHATPSPS